MSPETGEPCALKVARAVRGGADGKGIAVGYTYKDNEMKSDTRRETSPAAYPTKSCYYVRSRRNSRSPKGCEPHGDGVPIVVGIRESRIHGEAGQVTLTARSWRYSCEKRRNDTRRHQRSWQGREVSRRRLS